MPGARSNTRALARNASSHVTSSRECSSWNRSCARSDTIVRSNGSHVYRRLVPRICRMKLCSWSMWNGVTAFGDVTKIHPAR